MIEDELVSVNGHAVLFVSEDGARFSSLRPMELVARGLEHRADWVAVPVERMPDHFFALRSGVAGELLQKFVNYQIGLAVIGDIGEHVAESQALADLVRESNAGGQAWFLPDRASLEARLARLP